MRLNITEIINLRLVIMIRINRSLILIISLLILFIFTAQVSAVSELRIMAAASLQKPLNEIEEKFEANYPNYDLEINYAGSQTLYSQISLGVDFDLFLSANYFYLDELKKEKIIIKDKLFAENKLILVINSNKKDIDNLEELFNSNYSLIIAEESVPVGNYTLEMLDNYFNSIRVQNKRNRLKKNFKKAVISKEFDVKSVLNKVEIGAADAGFVYLSDYTSDSSLHKLNIPAEYNIRASYYLGLADNSNKGAEDIYNYILSSEAQQIFSNYNFKAGEDLDE